jgi:hypothetical protein
MPCNPVTLFRDLRTILRPTTHGSRPSSHRLCELHKVASRVASTGDIELPVALPNIMESDVGAGRGWIRYGKVAHAISEEGVSHGWDRGSATEP